MDDKAIGRRIKDERERRNISQQRLAEMAGIAHRQSIGKIEDGDRKVQAVELYGIAKALGIRPESLLFEASPTATTPQFLWRNVNAEAKIEWEGKFSAHIANFKFVEGVLELSNSEYLELPRKVINIEQATYSDAYSLAEQVREQFGLGSFPSTTLEKVLEERFGVRVFFVDLHEKGSAATTRSETPVIFLNRYEPPWRRNYSLAHELFHLITWSDEIAIRSETEPAFHDKNEKLAEAFAAGLLMPAEVLTAELKRVMRDGRLGYADIVAMARIFDVSTPALLFRLANLRFITFDKAKEIRDDSSMKELDRQDQDDRWHTPAPLSEKFILMAYQAYQSSKLSKARLAEMLEVPLIDVEDMLADRGLIEIDDNEIQISLS